MSQSADLKTELQIVQRFCKESAAAIHLESIQSGFSGAGIFRVTTPTATFALRRWPVNSLPRLRILMLHQFLKNLSEFDLPVAVPVLDRESQITTVRAENTYWQLEPWLPGEQITVDAASAEHIQSMMQTIAKIHFASETYMTSHSGTEWFKTTTERCPAILERIDLIEQWTPSRLARCGEAIAAAPQGFQTVSQAILQNYRIHFESILKELRQFSPHRCRLFTCWRDLWRDHILFSENQVTGVIDASAARYDHVGTDLSRLLGSFFGDNQQRWSYALDEYQKVRPLSNLDLELIRILDRSSVLLSGMTWIDRWARRKLDINQLAAIVARMETIETRMHHLR